MANVRVAVFILILAVRIKSSGSPLVVCIDQWETGDFDPNVVVFPSRSFFLLYRCKGLICPVEYKVRNSTDVHVNVSLFHFSLLSL